MLLSFLSTILNAQFTWSTVIKHPNQSHENRKPFQPQFLMLEQNKNSLSYQIQGFVSSFGHHKKTLRKIQIEKEIHQNTLHIKHTMLTKNGFGKEGAQIIGYNFQLQKHIKIPKSIQTIILTLYNDKQRMITTDTIQL